MIKKNVMFFYSHLTDRLRRGSDTTELQEQRNRVHFERQTLRGQVVDHQKPVSKTVIVRRRFKVHEK